MSYIPIKSINIPAALNDPNLSHRDIFSKRYGESFEYYYPSKIKETIKKDDFNQYLIQLQKYFNALNNLKSFNNEGLNCEINIPHYFYEKDFSVHRKDIFKSLIPLSSNDLGSTLATTSQTQNQLSHLLDGIEAKIAYNVSKKSESFLNALTYISSLKEYIKNLENSVTKSRKSFLNYSKIYLLKVLNLLELIIKYSNIQKILKKLKIMSALSQSQPTLQIFLANNEYLDAFDLVASSRNILQRDLYGIRSYRHADAQFQEIENVIFRMLWAEFGDIILKYLKNVQNVNTSYYTHMESRGQNNYMLNLLSNLNSQNDQITQLPMDDFERITSNLPGLKDLSTHLTPTILGMFYLKNLSFLELFQEESCAIIDEAIIMHLKRIIKNRAFNNNNNTNISKDGFSDSKSKTTVDAYKNTNLNDESNFLLEHLPRINLKSLLKFYNALMGRLLSHIYNIQTFIIFVLLLVLTYSNKYYLLQHSNSQTNMSPPVLNQKLASLHQNDGSSEKSFLSSQWKEKTFDKLWKVLEDILQYLQDEMTKILEKWSLSFNPLFLIDFHLESNNELRKSEQDALQQRSSKQDDSLRFNTENNKLITALINLQTMLDISKHFYSDINTDLTYFDILKRHVLFGSQTHQTQNILEINPSNTTSITSFGLASPRLLKPSSNYPVGHNPFSDQEDDQEEGETNSNVNHNKSINKTLQTSVNCDVVVDYHVETFAMQSSSPQSTSLASMNEDRISSILENISVSDRMSTTKSTSKGDDSSYNNPFTNDLPDQRDKLLEDSGIPSFQIYGTSHINLINKLINQTLDFLVNRCRRAMQHVLLKEKWKPVDIPKSVDYIYDRIIIHLDIVELSSLLTLPEEETGDAVKQLIFDKQAYFFTNSGIHMVRYILLYVTLSESFNFAQKFMYNAIYQLFKLYNSNVCQLLLGAGAINSAGLKSITIKHLAISLNGLLFFSKMINFLWDPEKYASDTESPTNTFICDQFKMSDKHYQILFQEYSIHVEDTMNKIAEIMEHNLSNYIAEWEVKAPTPSTTFTNITKQFELFFNNLKPLIPFEILKAIMSKIDLSLKRLIKYKVNSLGITNDGGPRAGVLISELLYYQDSVRKLGLGTLNCSTNSKNNSCHQNNNQHHHDQNHLNDLANHVKNGESDNINGGGGGGSENIWDFIS